jgi:hypothetical protein
MRWDFKDITIKCHDYGYDYGYGCSTRLIYLIKKIYICLSVLMQFMEKIMQMKKVAKSLGDA